MSYALSVVIPFYNEEDNATPLIEEIVTHMPKDVTYEIVAVEDGGTDKTYDNLVQLQKKVKQLVVLKHVRNFGQSASQLSGVRHASHEWIVTMDGDGQNMPEDLPKFIESLNILAPKHPEGL